MTSQENNPIGFLQEICQKHGFAFPKFIDLEFSGPDHSREFTVMCTFQDLEVLGKARQKKLAKSNAAAIMIDLLKEKNFFNTIPSGVKEVKASSENLQKSPISLIMEYTQQKCLQPPQFMIASSMGNFFCQCTIKDKTTHGQGINKKTAKTEAALRMCRELEIIYINEDTIPVENGKVETAHRALTTIKTELEENSNATTTVVLPEFKIDSSDEEEENRTESKPLELELISKFEAVKLEPEPECKKVPDSLLEAETSPGDTRIHKSKTSDILEKWVGNDRNK